MDYEVTSGETSASVLLGNGDTMDVQSSGTALGTTIGAGGLLTALGGSTVTNTTVENGGEFLLAGNVTLAGTTIANGGTFAIELTSAFLPGAPTSVGIVVSGGGVLNVVNGTASSTVVLSEGTLA